MRLPTKTVLASGIRSEPRRMGLAQQAGYPRPQEPARTSIVSILSVASLLIWMPGLATMASACGAGVATHKGAAKDHNGMKAETFFTLLDSSLGSNFSSAILVFGGCFTAGFTNKAGTSAVGTSGKPLAVLAATSATNEAQCNGGDSNGNTFTRGVTDGLGGDPGTAQDGFDAGKARAKRAAKIDERVQDPTLTPLAGGAGIRLGVSASSYHAILFMGKPETVQDWMDLQSQYEELRAKGYPAANIDCYFGRGERAPGPDGTPILSKPDFSAGKSLKQAHDDSPAGTAYNDSGQTIKAATEKNLEDALKALKAIADASPDEQYFLWFADHSVLHATAMVTSHDCTGTSLCSVGVSIDQTFLQLRHDDPPAILLKPVGIVQSNHTVYINGIPAGLIDPALDGTLQSFPINLNQLIVGTNFVSVSNPGYTFQLNEVAITSGTVPLFPVSAVDAQPRPLLGAWLQAALAAALLGTAAWALQRSTRHAG